MVNDERRNSVYDRAIRDATIGRRVIDIGGGTGLLAMMAAARVRRRLSPSSAWRTWRNARGKC